MYRNWSRPEFIKTNYKGESTSDMGDTQIVMEFCYVMLLLVCVCEPKYSEVVHGNFRFLTAVTYNRLTRCDVAYFVECESDLTGTKGCNK